MGSIESVKLSMAKCFQPSLLPTMSQSIGVTAVMGPIGVGKSTYVTGAGTGLAFTEPTDQEALRAYIDNPRRYAFPFQMGKMHEAIARMWLSWDKDGALVERPPLENVLFAVVNYEVGYMSEAAYRRYKARITEYATNEEQHAIKYILFHAHEGTCWQRLTSRARAGEDKYKVRGWKTPFPFRRFSTPSWHKVDADGRQVFYWERLADGYVRLFLEIALRLQGLLPPSAWKLRLPSVVSWEVFGTREDVARALAIEPRVELTEWRQDGVFRVDDYFALPVHDEEAVAWRDCFFRHIAQHGSVRVSLGNLDTLRGKFCFYD